MPNSIRHRTLRLGLAALALAAGLGLALAATVQTLVAKRCG